MFQVGVENLDLIKYLVGQLRQDDKDRVDYLRSFVPKARLEDWKLSVAGQRVQIIKRTSKGREITKLGYDHLGIKPERGYQNSIFE